MHYFENNNKSNVRGIIRQARIKGIPIFFCDIMEADLALLIQFLLPYVELAGGVMGLTKDIYTRLRSKEKSKMTRRDAIKYLTYLYLMSSMLPKFILDFTKNYASNELSHSSIDVDEKIHPEVNLLKVTFRNHLLAYKLLRLQSMLKSGDKKPEIAMITGAHHTGIEDILQKPPKEILNNIKSIWEFMHKIGVVDIKETCKNIAKIARFDFDHKAGEWKVRIYTDKSLCNMFSRK